jgi:DNA polymerase III subunit beta
MELVVRKTDLLRELQLFQGIVERKNTIPDPRERADRGRRRRGEAAGDRPRGRAAQPCEASVAKGALTLPAKKLFEIVKALPETDVRIEEDKSGVKVAADRFESRMQTLPRDDFPVAARRRASRHGRAAARRLKQMVAKTQFAITGRGHALLPERRAVRPAPDSMSLVATDGHRLALITVPREAAPAQGRARKRSRVILPKKTLLELGRCSPRARDDIQYERGENHLFFEVGGRAADLADDRRAVPGLRARHPEGERQAIEFDRDRLTSAVRAWRCSRTSARAR